jgi:hypothetical protein
MTNNIIKKNDGVYLIGPDEIIFMFIKDVRELSLDGSDAHVQIFEISLIHHLFLLLKVFI